METLKSKIKEKKDNIDTAKEAWIKEELAGFESEQRTKLNLETNTKRHWSRPSEDGFYENQKSRTTILVGGLTILQDHFMEAALSGIGYSVSALPCPDNDALRHGKEFGNRGQCNPTYYTVGNLVKYLKDLKAESGMSVKEINEKYIFVTAGACGPCRFGMYEAEYRKALTDSGFGGFRVILFEQKVDIQSAEKQGLKLNLKFFMALIKAIMAGDLVNALGYRIRPYEQVKGSTDKVIEEAKKLLYNTFSKKKSLSIALFKIRRKFAKIKVNRLETKPVVEIIGEFWAMTTEGDGNYRIHKWLEKEGAEIHIQQVTYWLKYVLWEARKFYLDRINLQGIDDKGIKSVKAAKSALRYIKLGRLVLKAYYYTYAWLAGLKKAKLPDMDEIAKYAHDYYNTNLSGGEGHMEVGKFIMASKKKKAHMVLSIKPFGCMPSSGVSDGIQSKIQELYPDVIFYPIETSGDGDVNVYSRVQMMLFKAKQAAKTEFDKMLLQNNTTKEALEKRVTTRYKKASYKIESSSKTSTSSNFAMDLLKNKAS